MRPTRVGGDDSFSAVTLGAGLDLYYTPIHGKFSLLGISAIRYDLAMTAGAHLLQVEGAGSDGFKPAPEVGITSNFFINDQMAITVFYKNFIYSRADHSIIINGVATSEETWAMQGMGGVYFSFFTGKPTIGYE